MTDRNQQQPGHEPVEQDASGDLIDPVAIRAAAVSKPTKPSSATPALPGVIGIAVIPATSPYAAATASQPSLHLPESRRTARSVPGASILPLSWRQWQESTSTTCRTGGRLPRRVSARRRLRGCRRASDLRSRARDRTRRAVEPAAGSLSVRRCDPSVNPAAATMMASATEAVTMTEKKPDSGTSASTMSTPAMDGKMRLAPIENTAAPDDSGGRLRGGHAPGLIHPKPDWQVAGPRESTEETAVGPRLASTTAPHGQLVDERRGQGALGDDPDHPAEGERECSRRRTARRSTDGPRPSRGRRTR